MITLISLDDKYRAYTTHVNRTANMKATHPRGVQEGMVIDSEIVFSK